ncbi:MAG: lipopolysaccharide heptosyltransferase I [Bacillota bacterium]
MENDNPEKILITRLSAIGDVIHALPAAYAVRKKYPDAQIDWLVEDKSYPLVTLNPYIDNIIILPRKEWNSIRKNKGFLQAIKSFTAFFKKMRKEQYDIFLDLHGLFKSAFAGFLIKADLRLGPADGRELSTFFYQAKIDIPDKKMHQVERALHLASAVGIETEEINYGLIISDVLNNNIDIVFNTYRIPEKKKLVVINPFTTWESKNWYLERYFELAEKLIDDGHYIIFTGSKKDRKKIEAFEKKDSNNYVNLAGKTSLKELAAVYKRADLYIGGDTGPTHLAAALGVKVISLMGPTDPDTHGPYGRGNTVIQDNSLECIGCWQRSCSRDKKCMKLITVEQVLRIAKKKLDD